MPLMNITTMDLANGVYKRKDVALGDKKLCIRKERGKLKDHLAKGLLGLATPPLGPCKGKTYVAHE
jgi:hypothetical protein